MRIGREIAIGRGVDVGEVAAPAARDEDLLPHLVGMIDQQHPAPALAGNGGAHQPGGTAPQHDRIIVAHVSVQLGDRFSPSSLARSFTDSSLRVSALAIAFSAMPFLASVWSFWISSVPPRLAMSFEFFGHAQFLQSGFVNLPRRC
jgi:hypothetical protein